MQCVFSFRHVHCVNLGYAFYIPFYLVFQAGRSHSLSFILLSFSSSVSHSLLHAHVCLFLLLSFNQLPHYFPHAPSASLLLSHSFFSDNAERLYTVWLLVNVPFVFIFQSWFSYAYKGGWESATCYLSKNCIPSSHHWPAWQESAAKRRSPAGSPDAYCTAEDIYSIEIQVQVQYSRATSKSVTIWPRTSDATPCFVLTSLWTLIVSLFISISRVFTLHMPKRAALANHCKTWCNTE